MATATVTTDEWLALTRQIERHEGKRLKPYVDTVGKLTIGIGRNLDDKGISDAEAYALLDHDLVDVHLALTAKLAPWYAALSPIRQRVLIDMGFNLGVPGVLKFKQTLASIEAGDYQLAARQMLKSVWAQQVGARATRLSEMMRTNREQP